MSGSIKPQFIGPGRPAVSRDDGAAPESPARPVDVDEIALLLDESPAGVYRSGPDGNVIYAGGRLFQRAGLAGAGPWGKRWEGYLHPGDRAAVESAWATAIRDRSHFSLEYRVVFPDGQELWVLSQAKPQFDVTGAFLGHVGATIEITQRKQSEDALRQSQQRYRSIIGALGDGVLFIDADGNIVECNGRAEEILGRGIDELRGRNIGSQPIQIIRENGVPFPQDELPPAVSLRTGEPCTGAVFGVRQPGKRAIWVTANCQPLFHPGETRPYSVVCSLVDITDHRNTELALRRAKDEAEAANRTKSAFLANMSHELRTPLNAVIGFAEIMRDELLGPLGADHYRDYAADIHQSGKHLLDLINDILDLSKIEAGRLELHEEDCDVPELLASSLRLMNERAHASDLRIEQRFPDRLPLLRADARSLKQILLNLVSNAIKFTPSGGRIVIGASVDDDAFRLTVEDTGIGMTAEGLKKALEAFGQIDSSLSRKYEGTGLGLPLTRALTELHGGRLEFRSALGEGTSVTSVFPRQRIIRELPPV